MSKSGASRKALTGAAVAASEGTMPRGEGGRFMLEPSTDIGEKPTFGWFDKSRCYIPKFQRRLNQDHVNSLIKTFHWSLVQPFTVGPEDERGFPLVNGQHEWSATLAFPQITDVPLWIVSESEYHRLVTIFIGMNKHRLTITPLAIYSAQLEGGDENAKWVDSVLAEAGISFPKASFGGDLPPLTTSALGTIKQLRSVEKYLREALTLMARAWPEQRNAFRSEMIKGVTKFIGLQEANGMDKARLHEVLTKINSAHFAADARRKADDYNTNTVETVIDMLTDTYNRHLALKKQLPYVRLGDLKAPKSK